MEIQDGEGDFAKKPELCYRTSGCANEIWANNNWSGCKTPQSEHEIETDVAEEAT
jgi:hypothetical protein